MLENIIRDARLAAMQAVGEVKDVIHDATTKLPEQVGDFSKQQVQNIPIAKGDMEYMNNSWGMMSATVTANQIDMIADKVNFIANMIQNGLISFDAIEKELMAMASQPTPPQPSQLVSLASRIDSSQKQAFGGLQELRALMEGIDKATDKLQGGTSGSWNTTLCNNPWNK